MLQQEVLELNDYFDPGELPEKEHKLLESSIVAKDKHDLPFENQCFSAMSKSGISMLTLMADDQSLLDPLKTLILNIEDQIRKYNIQDATLSSIQEADLLGVIDTMETLFHLSDFKHLQAKKNRLKRRLSEWAPSSYLIESALKDFFNTSAASSINEAAKKDAEKQAEKDRVRCVHIRRLIELKVFK